MAASVRVERKAFTDTRIDALTELAGYANRHEALGRLALLWATCTEENTHVLPEILVRQVLGPKGVDALLSAGLGRKQKRGIYIAGSKGRIEWLENKRRNGKLGGRPKQTDSKPLGFQPADFSKPTPNPPAPAPAPAPAQRQDTARAIEGSPLNPGAEALRELWADGLPVRSVSDFEQAMSSWRWSLQFRGKDRARLKRILEAGPIEPHEIAEHRPRAEEKAQPIARVAFFLGCIETGRDDVKREASKPPPPAARARELPPEWREYKPGASE